MNFERGDNNTGACSIFFALLAVLFIGLKMTGYIDWSWVWVLSPLWLPVAIGLVVLIILALIGGLAGLLD